MTHLAIFSSYYINHPPTTHGDVIVLQIPSWQKVLKIMVISIASLLWIEV